MMTTIRLLQYNSHPVHRDRRSSNINIHRINIQHNVTLHIATHMAARFSLLLLSNINIATHMAARFNHNHNLPLDISIAIHMAARMRPSNRRWSASRRRPRPQRRQLRSCSPR